MASEEPARSAATRSGAQHGLRVAVVIPCYNGRRYLEQCLASVTRVADPTWEVLVVDDGSTEDIRDIIERFAPAVRYLRQPNQGPSAARNAGLRQTSAEFVRFLDADDLLLSKEVSDEQIALLERNPQLGMVYGLALRVDAEGRPFGYCGPAFARHSYLRSGEQEIRDLLFGNHVTTSTVIVRRSVVEQVGPFREDLSGGEDWDLWLRMAGVSGVGYLTGLVAAYRVHAASVTAGYSPEPWLVMHREILACAYSDEGFARRYGSLKKLAFVRLDQMAASLAFKRAPRDVARAYALKAVSSSLSAGVWSGVVGGAFIVGKTFLPLRLRYQLQQARLAARRLSASKHVIHLMSRYARA